MWSPESSAAAIRRLIAGLLLLAGALLAGCGSAPLSAMTPVQRQQFDTLTSAMTTAANFQGPYPELLTAAAAAQTACAAADGSEPLIAAYVASCAPAMRVAELSALLHTRCSTQNTACAHTLIHLSRATKALAGDVAAISAQATSEVKDTSCAKLLSAPQDELNGYLAVAADVQLMADAVTAGDEAGLDQAAAAVKRASDQINTEDPENTKSAADQIADFHKACKVSAT